MLEQPIRPKRPLALITFTQLKAALKFDRFPPALSLHDVLLILKILISLSLLITHAPLFILV
jgi:hypothetical protein